MLRINGNEGIPQRGGVGNQGIPINRYRMPHELRSASLGQRSPAQTTNPPMERHRAPEAPGRTLKWAYGVTTVGKRRNTTLPRTLSSLSAAGFPAPRLFVDGDWDLGSWHNEFHLEVTTRWPTVRTYGNWILSLYEIYLRDPLCDRYAIFQDDFITSLNLRAYLESCIYQPRTYWNLYTFPENQALCPRGADGRQQVGWFRSNQLGKGAVALVFDRETTVTLLTHQHMVERPQSVHRGHRSVDGGAVTALRKAGWMELCHHPSLVQHVGYVSSMGNDPHAQAQSFKGEKFDLMTLLGDRYHAEGQTNAREEQAHGQIQVGGRGGEGVDQSGNHEGEGGDLARAPVRLRREEGEIEPPVGMGDADDGDDGGGRGGHGERGGEGEEGDGGGPEPARTTEGDPCGGTPHTIQLSSWGEDNHTEQQPGEGARDSTGDRRGGGRIIRPAVSYHRPLSATRPTKPAAAEGPAGMVSEPLARGEGMTREKALSLMVAPGDKRPGKWRDGVIQVHVTRACDKACFNCTQGSNLRGKAHMITPEEFTQALDSLEGYWGVVGLFGGNPTLHPKFPELCDILKGKFPKEQRGLWSNHPHGHGKVCRETFDPNVSNLNVHLDREAHAEFKRDWPESHPFGLHEDSRHSPVYTALHDIIPDESERWELISRCDINRHWSAMVCVVPGKGVRAYFCEIAAAQAILHAEDPESEWPDLGLPATPGWWRKPMTEFAAQVEHHCHRCGVPLRGYGELACKDDAQGVEQVSATHEGVYRPKRGSRRVELVTVRDQLREGRIGRSTDYLGNSKR